jgi:hypothetical protein
MDIQVVNLLKYNNSTDYLLMGTEFLFIVFTIYYFIQEWLEYRASGSAYFADLGRHTSNFSIKIMRHSPDFSPVFPSWQSRSTDTSVDKCLDQIMTQVTNILPKDQLG